MQHRAIYPIGQFGVVFTQLGAISRALHTKGTVPVRITISLCTLAVAGLLGLFYPVSAFAQAQQPAPAQKAFGPRVKPGQAGQPGQPPQRHRAAETVATHGAWQIQCSAPAASGDQAGKKACGMVQLTRSEKNAKVVSPSFGQDQTGRQRRHHDAHPGAHRGLPAHGRCPGNRWRSRRPRALYPLPAANLRGLGGSLGGYPRKMQKGTAANFIIYEAPGLGIPMKISLDGFSAALENLNTL